jgi:hypothetical protein
VKKSVLPKSNFRWHRTGNLGGTEWKVGSTWLAQNVVWSFPKTTLCGECKVSVLLPTSTREPS